MVAYYVEYLVLVLVNIVSEIAALNYDIHDLLSLHFSCGGEGHFARDCSEEPKERRSGGGGGRACYRCGDPGHVKSECTAEDS